MLGVRLAILPFLLGFFPHPQMPHAALRSALVPDPRLAGVPVPTLPTRPLRTLRMLCTLMMLAVGDLGRAIVLLSIGLRERSSGTGVRDGDVKLVLRASAKLSCN